MIVIINHVSFMFLNTDLLKALDNILRLKAKKEDVLSLENKLVTYRERFENDIFHLYCVEANVARRMLREAYPEFNLPEISYFEGESKVD